MFSNFGYPRILQSDNGSEFKNVTVKLLTESKGIDHCNMDPANSKPLSYEELIERIDHMSNIVFPAIMDQTNKYVEQMKVQFEKYNTIIDDFEEGPLKLWRKSKRGSYILYDEMNGLMPRDYAHLNSKEW